MDPNHFHDLLSYESPKGKAFFGAGIRSYGFVTIYGREQCSGITNRQKDYISSEVLIIGVLMDGSFVAVQKGVVIFINQTDPDYEDDWQSCSIRSSWTLGEFASLLESAAETLPADYEEAASQFE